MSVDALYWVLHYSSAKGVDKFILTCIAWHETGNSGHSWPGLKTLAEESGVSEPGVRAAIARLVELQELTYERGGDQGQNKSTFFLPGFVAWKEEQRRVKGVKGVSDGFGTGNRRVNEEIVNTVESTSSKPNTERDIKEREESPLPLCKEERRAIPKPVREPKVRREFQRTIPAKREFVPPPKPPQDWDWFAGMWHRYTDSYPISKKDFWEELEARLDFLSKEQVEDRLSRWLDQRTGKTTGWQAIDFLRDCRIMPDKEEDDIPKIVNPV